MLPALYVTVIISVFYKECTPHITHTYTTNTHTHTHTILEREHELHFNLCKWSNPSKTGDAAAEVLTILQIGFFLSMCVSDNSSTQCPFAGNLCSHFCPQPLMCQIPPCGLGSVCARISAFPCVKQNSLWGRVTIPSYCLSGCKVTYCVMIIPFSAVNPFC